MLAFVSGLLFFFLEVFSLYTLASGSEFQASFLCG